MLTGFPDVLMVWHAYQLNPRCFLEDCMLFGKMNAWRTGLPWAIINACIENEAFEYDPGTDSRELFESRTNFRWDSLEDPTDVVVECPKCQSKYAVSWTKWDQSDAWNMTSKGTQYGEDSRSGYADKAFYFKCTSASCSYKNAAISHEILRAQKFRKDMMAAKDQDIPMQGTVLDDKGTSIPKVQIQDHSM